MVPVSTCGLLENFLERQEVCRYSIYFLNYYKLRISPVNYKHDVQNYLTFQVCLMEFLFRKSSTEPFSLHKYRQLRMCCRLSARGNHESRVLFFMFQVMTRKIFWVPRNCIFNGISCVVILYSPDGCSNFFLTVSPTRNFVLFSMKVWCSLNDLDELLRFGPFSLR